MSTLDDKARREIEELLPFLANETLEGAERARVEAAVKSDASLAAELEYLQGLRAEVKSRAIGASPGEFGLARLMRDIDQIEKSEQVADVATDQGTPPISNIWRLAAAAAVTLFVAQSAMIWTAPETLMELAGGGSVSDYEGPVLVVAFEGTSTEATIRQLLLDQGLEIITGPSSLGLYRLSVASEDDVEAALAALNAAQGVVESAEKE